MASRCRVCSHIHHAKIDALVAEGIALSHICKRYHVPIQAMWAHNMHMRKDSLKAESVPQQSPSSPQPDLPIRDMVKRKLLELANAGDPRVLLELLNRPSLFDEKPVEDPRYELTKLLAAVESRAMTQNAYHLRDQFNSHVHHRLEMSGEHGLARRWEALSTESKEQLWQEIVENLREGSSDALDKAQAVQ